MPDSPILAAGSLKAVERMAPTNIRTLIGTLLGNRDKITEENLSKSEIEALRVAAQRSSKAKTRGRPGITYRDYGEWGKYDNFDEAGWGESLKRSFTDPIYRLKTTLGLADTKVDAQGNTHVTDTYDFNHSGPGQYIVNDVKRNGLKALKPHLGNPTFILDALGYLMAPETAKNRRPVDINLGPIGQQLKKK